MKVLVCGGAGYIGSHLVRELHRGGKHSVVVADSLAATHGAREHIPADIPLEVGDVRDSAFLDHVFTAHRPTAVVHMCASIVVPDSCADPLSYYDNNVVGTLRMLQAMQRHQCRWIVFSSTAALFGTPKDGAGPIPPDAPVHPESPYGETKHVAELMMRDCDPAYGIKNVCLRYFNACGAHADGDIGETHDPETHLIPIVLQVPLGKREKVFIMGTDYPTPDGTCVRDYIHVSDLATAHIAALEYLERGQPSRAFNLGTGTGYSVRQVIEAARKVTGHAIPAEEKPRRLGDPPFLVASPKEAMAVLGWQPTHSAIENIIATAWNFHQKHPNGYHGNSKC